MNEPVHLERMLRSLQKTTGTEPALSFFTVLDGARDPQIYGAVPVAKVEYRPLFMGPLPRVMAEAAPYLVRFEPDSRFAEWLGDQGWGMDWGIFLRSRARLDEVARHLRRYLRVNDEDGKVIYFRFYDPRVLRAYLATCDGEELAAFFGPIDSFMAESETGEELMVYRVEESRLVTRAIGAIPAPDRGLAGLPPTQRGANP